MGLLDENDYVLVEDYHPGDDEKGYPGRMVLAMVKRDNQNHITPKAFAVLFPITDQRISPLFYINKTYPGIENVVNANGNIINTDTEDPNHPIHRGRAAVLTTLEQTPEYRSYAEVLILPIRLGLEEALRTTDSPL